MLLHFVLALDIYAIAVLTKLKMIVKEFSTT